MKWITKRNTVIFLMGIMLVGLVLSFTLVPGKRVERDEARLLSGDWETQIINDPENDRYFDGSRTVYCLLMTRRITEDMKGKVLSLRTNDSYVDAYVGDTAFDTAGTSLYHFGEKLRFSDSPGTYTHFIRMPERSQHRRTEKLSEGETQYLTIRIETVYANKFFTEYETELGAENELVYNALTGELSSSIPNVLVFVFGLMLVVIYVVSRTKQVEAPEALSLGALSLVFAVYANCPLFLNQYLFQNAVGQYYMNYFALFLLPLLAILYFEDLVPGLDMKWLFLGLTAVILGLSIVHFTGLASYTRSIKVFTASLGVFAVVSIIMIAMRFKSMSSVNRIALMTLLGFVLANVLFFIFVTTVGNQSFIAQTGFLIYLILAIVNGLKKIMQGIYRERENALLHEIAYTDNLTKLGNRYSLERDARNYPLDTLSIVSMDLNYLKYTNDTFGHAGGDALLRCAAACMSSVYGNVYRVGGDEFIALVTNASRSTLINMNAALQDRIADLNRERTSFGEYADRTDFRLGIAGGFASYERGDTSLEQIMNRADAEMYAAKKKMHAES